jgi:hypothetical protein
MIWWLVLLPPHEKGTRTEEEIVTSAVPYLFVSPDDKKAHLAQAASSLMVI